jgi:hypothetical protein
MPNAQGYNKQTHTKYNWPKYALAIFKILLKKNTCNKAKSSQPFTRLNNEGEPSTLGHLDLA